MAAVLFTLHGLLCRLGATDAMVAGYDAGDPVPVMVFDRVRDAMYAGEVRAGSRPDILICEIVRFEPWGGSTPLCRLRAERQGHGWSVVSLLIADRPVNAAPEDAIRFMSAVLAEIAAGRVPALQQHCGAVFGADLRIDPA